MADLDRTHDEAAKFQAETLTTSFLTQRLARAKGAAVLCDRCASSYGVAVLVGEGQGREWLCDCCLGRPEPKGPFRV